jgi:DNA-directed RNA polymerase subunit RPC12/RpoP
MEKESVSDSMMLRQVMNMKLLDKFGENQYTTIDCPHCNKGMAEAKWDSVNKYETTSSINERDEEYWEPEMLDFKYSLNYECIRCKGIVISTGEIRYLQIGGVDYRTGEEEYEDYYEYNPRYFNPTLSLINIPYRCPSEIKALLSRSFQIAFCDHSAAANRLRVALEAFTKIHLSGADLKGSLHAKLVTLEAKLGEASILSKAIKFIGNQGSHNDDDVPEYLLAFAYQAFEQMLIDLYGDREATTYELAKLFEGK